MPSIKGSSSGGYVMSWNKLFMNCVYVFCGYSALIDGTSSVTQATALPPLLRLTL